MQNRKPLRILVVIAVAALLLVPGLLMSLTWGGTLNLEVAAAATAIVIAAAIWLPSVKWFVAVVAGLLIAVPPFPYWHHQASPRGWRRTFRSAWMFGHQRFLKCSRSARPRPL